MTVGELIKKLKEYPEDMKIYKANYQCYVDTTYIEEIDIEQEQANSSDSDYGDNLDYNEIFLSI